MKRIIHIIVCTCAFFYCTTQNAGTVDDVGSGTISGQLLDRDGTAITHTVIVSLYTSDSLQTSATLLKTKTSGTKPYASVETDNGQYRFDSLDAGEYRIAVSEDGIIVGKKSDITLSPRQSILDTLCIDEVIRIPFTISGEQSEGVLVENTLIENSRVINIDSGYILKSVKAEKVSFKMVIQQNYVIDTIEATAMVEDDQSVTFQVVDTTVSITLVSRKKTKVIATVYSSIMPYLMDNDAIYCMYKYSTPGSITLVKVDLKSGTTRTYLFDNDLRLNIECESGEYVYFSCSQNSTVYRYPKSGNGELDIVAEFPSTDYSISIRVFDDYIYAIGRDYQGILRFNMTKDSIDTVIERGNWFDQDDEAFYWATVEDNLTHQSTLWKQNHTSTTPEILLSGKFFIEYMDNDYIYYYDRNDDRFSDDSTTYISGNGYIMRIGKTVGSTPSLVLGPNEYYDGDGVFLVINDNFYHTNLSGSLWKIPIDNPVDGAILIDKYGSYDQDDFEPVLLFDGTYIYWIAGPDPDGHISDDDAGVLLRTLIP